MGVILNFSGQAMGVILYFPGQAMGVRPPGGHPEEAGQGGLPPYRAALLPRPQGHGGSRILAVTSGIT